MESSLLLVLSLKHPLEFFNLRLHRAVERMRKKPDGFGLVSLSAYNKLCAGEPVEVGIEQRIAEKYWHGFVTVSGS